MNLTSNEQAHNAELRNNSSFHTNASSLNTDYDLAESRKRSLSSSANPGGSTKRLKQSLSCPGILQSSFSRKTLPCESDCGLSMITSSTLRDLITGGHGEVRYKIFDCRFPYEFEGGHIPGAINIPTLFEIASVFDGLERENSRLVIIFHCEFSSERGPEVMKAFRSLDRELNKEIWPSLFFPELYLLKGGYKEFWTSFPNLCTPSGYVKMLDNKTMSKHYHSLRKEKTSLRAPSASRLNLSFSARLEQQSEEM